MCSVNRYWRTSFQSSIALSNALRVSSTCFCFCTFRLIVPFPLVASKFSVICNCLIYPLFHDSIRKMHLLSANFLVFYFFRSSKWCVRAIYLGFHVFESGD